MIRALAIRAGLVIATTLISACGSDPAPTGPAAPTPPTGTVLVHVFGRALDFTTNTGVPGAVINFYLEGLPTIATSAVTDAAGRYSVTLSRGVYYNPRINGPDVDSNRGRLIAVAKETEADFLINGGTCIAFYGTVRDAVTGEPISGARVGFDRFLTGAQTGSDGSYRFDLGCPTPANPWQWPGTVGTTFMRVTREGYVTASPYGGRVESLFAARTQRIDVALRPSS